MYIENFTFLFNINKSRYTKNGAIYIYIKFLFNSFIKRFVLNIEHYYIVLFFLNSIDF